MKRLVLFALLTLAVIAVIPGCQQPQPQPEIIIIDENGNRQRPYSPQPYSPRPYCPCSPYSPYW